MTATAEVLHLVRNDLKRFRWGIAAFALVVAVAAGHPVYAIRSYDLFAHGTRLDLLPFVVFLGAVVTAASIIQGDPPTRFDAFWATKPIRPAAMYAAKLVTLAISVLGVAALGQAVTLRCIGMPTGATVSAAGAAIFGLGAALLIAALPAAVTRDLRSFIVAAALLVVLAFPLSSGVAAALMYTRTGNEVAYVAARVMLLTAAGLLFYLYRARADGWRMKALVMVVAACTMVIPLTGMMRHSAPGPARTARLASWPTTVSAQLDHDTVALYMDAAAMPPSARLVFVNPRVVLAFDDGTGVVLSRFLPQSKLPFTTASGFRALGGAAVPYQSSLLHLTFVLTDSIAQHLKMHSASLVIDGYIVEQVAVTLADLPMNADAHVNADGARITFRRVHDTASVQRIEVQAVSARLYDRGEGTPSELLQTEREDRLTPVDATGFFGRVLTYVATGNTGRDTLALRSAEISTWPVSLVLPSNEIYWQEIALVSDVTPLRTLPASPRLVISGWTYHSHAVMHERIPLSTSLPPRRRLPPPTLP